MVGRDRGTRSAHRRGGQRRRTRAIAALSLGVALFGHGCSTGPSIMTLALDPSAEERIWPRPPDVPRYRYAGELTGELNFEKLDRGEPSRARKILNWIVGLNHRSTRPIVLQRPQGGAVGNDGRIYVTDVSRGALFVFDPVAGKLLVWEMATEVEHFVAPIGVAVGGEGSVLVTDAELGFVARLSSSGEPLGTIGRGVLQRPTGIARDADRGLLYVADTRASDIKVFDETGILSALIGHEGDQPGALNAPTYLAVGGGRIAVSDTLNSRVQVFDDDGDLLQHFGERGLYVGNFARPKGVAVGPNGIIYVVESYHDHLLVFDAEGRLLMAIGGTGKEPGHFYLPAGTWTDPAGRVYVADMFNGRVSIFEPITESEETE